MLCSSKLKRILLNIEDDFSLIEPFLYRVCYFGGTGSSSKTDYT